MLPHTTSPQKTYIIILNEINAKTCTIPKSLRYNNKPIAYIAFENEADYNEAKQKKFALNGKVLQWVSILDKTCDICGSADHIKNNCKQGRQSNENKRFHHLYERY